MIPPRILVLGGHGGTGRVFCRGLLKHSDVRVIVAGRRKERAWSLASQLNHVDPERMLADMERMGVRHRIDRTPALPPVS